MPWDFKRRYLAVPVGVMPIAESRVKHDFNESGPMKAIFSRHLEGLERAAKAYAAIFLVNTMPTPEGVKTLLDDMAPRNPKAKAADPRQYVDMSFVQELESSGYLKQFTSVNP